MSYHVITGFLADKNIGSPKPKLKNTIFIHKSISGWNLIVDVNEERQLRMLASKNIGKIGSGWNDGDQANIKIQLQTTNDRIPEFVKTNPSYNQFTASIKEKGYVEINNKLNKICESFKPELEFYERKWPGSSILEINDFLLSLVPSFKSLLEDQNLDEYISQIIDEAADVQPKNKKQYQKAKHQVSKPTETVSVQEHNKLKATVDALTGVNESLRQRIDDLSKTENKTGLYQ